MFKPQQRQEVWPEEPDTIVGFLSVCVYKSIFNLHIKKDEWRDRQFKKNLKCHIQLKKFAYQKVTAMETE